MKGYRISRSNLFFLELVLVLGLFTLTSLVLLGVFGKANTLRVASRDETQAMILLQNAAECIRGDEEGKLVFPLYYDRNFKAVKVDKAYYRLERTYWLEEQLGGNLEKNTLGIYSTDKQKPLWALDFTFYRKR